MTSPMFTNPDGSLVRRQDPGVPRPSSGDLISTIQRRWRDDFSGSAVSLENWDVATAGSGMSAAVSGSNLVITTGTTSGASYTLTSKFTMSPACRLLVDLGYSAKPTGQRVEIELVAVNDDGTLNESDHMGIRISGDDSATLTDARCTSSNGGSADSVATFTVGTVSTAQIFELELGIDEVWWHTRAVNSVNGRTGSQVRQENVPDPNRLYKVRIRVINTATASASATVTIPFVAVTDYAELTAEITGARGGSGQAQAMPVIPTGTQTIQGSINLAPSGSTLNVTNPTKVNTAATTNASTPRNVASRIDGWHLTNTAAAVRYVKIFNKATAPTLGTDVPVLVIALPPGELSEVILPVSLHLSSGFSLAVTAGAADTDATALPAANEVVGSIFSRNA